MSGRRTGALAAAALLLGLPIVGAPVAEAQESEDRAECDVIAVAGGDEVKNDCNNKLPQLILLPGVGVEGDPDPGLPSVDPTFVAALVPPPNETVEFEVNLGATGDTAEPGDDYEDAALNPVQFTPNDPVKTFRVDVVENKVGFDGVEGGDRPVETFTVTLATDDLGEGHELLSASTQGIIVDDDIGPDEVLSLVPPQIIVTPGVAQEGMDLAFTAVMVPPPMGSDEFVFDVVAEGGEVPLDDLAAGPEDFRNPSKSEVTFDKDTPTKDFTVPAEPDATVESVIEVFSVRLDGKGEAQGIPSTGGVGLIVDADTTKDSDGDSIPDVADDLTDADEDDDGPDGEGDGLPNAVDEGPTDLDKDNDDDGQIDAIENLDSNNDGIPDELWEAFLKALLESTGDDEFDDCDLDVGKDDDTEGCDLDADQDSVEDDKDFPASPDAKDIVTIAFRAFNFAVEELPPPLDGIVTGSIVEGVLVPLFDDDGDGDVDAEDLDRSPEGGDDNIIGDDILAVVTETATLLQGGLTPEVSVSGPEPVDEGNSDTTNAVFTVSLDTPSLLPVKVDVATQDGTAEAGGDYSDYNALADDATVTFDPLVTEQTVTVPVIGDTHAEADETFDVTISNPRIEDIPQVGDPVPPDQLLAEISDEENGNRASATIRDDDGPAPVLTVTDVTVDEPEEGGEGSATVTVEVTGIDDDGPPQTISVDIATVAGTATEDDDYEPAPVPPSLTFDPGETTKDVSITVNGDGLDENNETFSVVLSNQRNAIVAVGSNGVGTVTIVDSVTDEPPVASVGDVTVSEAKVDGALAVLEFPVTLSQASGRQVRVDFRTTDDGDAQPADYVADSGTVTIPAGEDTVNIPITVNHDDIYERNQTVALELSGAVNATLGTTEATGTIEDDEAAPELSVNDVTVEEPDDAVFTVTRVFPPGTGSTEVVSVVGVSTLVVDGGAEAGSDYEPLPDGFSVVNRPWVASQ